MDKILQSVSGSKNVSVTNDGATILQSIYVDNPAAKYVCPPPPPSPSPPPTNTHTHTPTPRCCDVPHVPPSADRKYTCSARPVCADGVQQGAAGHFQGPG